MVMLRLEARRGYEPWKPYRELAPWGPWQEHEPRANNYKEHLAWYLLVMQKSWRLIACGGGVSLYASGFHPLPMALGHRWKQILRWMGLGSWYGRSGAPQILRHPSACLRESISPASRRREGRLLMLKNRFFPFSSLVQGSLTVFEETEFPAWPWPAEPCFGRTA